MTDTDDETVRIEILRGIWKARPADLRKVEHVGGYHQSMKRMYPNLLPSRDNGSDDAFIRILDGLIL
jgi:hypothetical protein